jgi:DNA-binding CsgD family transcriptional regulator
MGTGDQLPNDWEQRREKAFIKCNNRCVNCGAEGGIDGKSVLEVHHVVPVHDDGSHRVSNLVTLCLDCHPKADQWADPSTSIEDYDGWKEQARFLKQTTWLSESESKVYVLRSRGWNPGDIADEIGSTKNSISALQPRVKKKIERSKHTIAVLEEEFY